MDSQIFRKIQTFEYNTKTEIQRDTVYGAATGAGNTITGDCSVRARIIDVRRGATSIFSNVMVSNPAGSTTAFHVQTCP